MCMYSLYAYMSVYGMWDLFFFFDTYKRAEQKWSLEFLALIFQTILRIIGEYIKQLTKESLNIFSDGKCQ